MPKKGFIFLKDVKRVTEPQVSLPETETAPASPEGLKEEPSVGREVSETAPAYELPHYLGHLTLSCGLYASLYAVALLLEVAYEFDRFARNAIVLAVLIFCFVFGSSFGLLFMGRSRILAGKSGVLGLLTSGFIITALAVYGVLGFYLPGTSVTEANFQTYPAHAAYLKDVIYFLPLALLFMIIPFHLVNSVGREIVAGDRRAARNLLLGRRRGLTPEGSIFLRPSMLLALLVVAIIGSQLATSRLIENLKPGEHTYLFTVLAEGRRLIYFTLCAECLIWYYRALGGLKKDVMGSAR